MYNGNVAGTGERMVNRCSCNGNVAGDTGITRCNFVYECLYDLLEEVLGERNNRRNCNWVYECLQELLEEVLEEEENNNCRCKKWVCR